MKNKLFTGIFLTLISLVSLTVGAAAKVDFNGTWKLDAAKSEGIPPDMEQMMTVKQKDDEIDIETKVKTPQGEQAVPDSYVLSGKTVEFTRDAPNNKKQKIKRTSKWTENGIEVSEEAVVETPDGNTATIIVKRRWTLSADGKTLVIEMDVDGPQGKQFLKRTFIKI
jgi:hypothetical protein